ncbi:MAG: hypothetical protein ABSA02_39255 [Trebonia sp.]|jgi:hypothetical protein
MVLLVHQPGRVRYDYEVPIGAVIDYAVSRPDVDPDRIAAGEGTTTGWSGGAATRRACGCTRTGSGITSAIPG